MLKKPFLLFSSAVVLGFVAMLLLLWLLQFFADTPVSQAQHFRTLTESVYVSEQISPDDLAAIDAYPFATVIDVRC